MQNDLYAILNIHWDGGWLENDIPNGYSEEVNNKQKYYGRRLPPISAIMMNICCLPDVMSLM